jgi:hypothetical protein
MMKTIQECAQFLEEVGMATVLPGKRALFPCLLWQAQGHRGAFSGDDPAFHNIWKWKDQLPARGLAWAGRLLDQQVLLIHVRLLPILLGYRGPLDAAELYEDGQLDRNAWRLWEVLSQSKKPMGRQELRDTLGLNDKKAASTFDRACRDLERLLVLTRAGSARRANGWDSNAYALVDRHFATLKALPRFEAAPRLRDALQQAAPTATPTQLRRWLSHLG